MGQSASSSARGSRGARDGDDEVQGIKRQRVRVDKDTEVDVEQTVRSEGADDNAEGEISEQDGTESPEIKARRIPKGPSKEEKRLHDLTHVPFRSWCPKCVAGRACRGPHPESD